MHPCLTFSPDGRQLAAGYKEWKASTLDLAGGPRGSQTFPTGERCLTVGYSPDGQWLATGTKGGFVRLWNMASGKCPRPAIRLGGQVTAAEFSADGRFLATAAAHGPCNSGSWRSTRRISP